MQVSNLVQNLMLYLSTFYYFTVKTSEKKDSSINDSSKMLRIPNKSKSSDIINKSPLVTPVSPSPLPAPKYDWFQTDSLINIAIYTKWKQISRDRVVIFLKQQVPILISMIG